LIYFFSSEDGDVKEERRRMRPVILDILSIRANQIADPLDTSELTGGESFPFVCNGNVDFDTGSPELMTLSRRCKRSGWSGLVYLLAIADELAGWLVRFVHPLFAYFKITAFLMLELSLALLIDTVSVSLVQSWRRAS